MSATVLEPLRIVTHEHDATAKNEGSHSAVSWAAVIAGAFVTAALGLILLALGAGMGLSSLSLWSASGGTTAAAGNGAFFWIAGLEIVASAAGGYMAGRLRTKWVDVHSDEVYFRDTAHGFLAWCVAFVLTAGFLTSAASTMVGDSRAGAGTRVEQTADAADRYFVDQLYRVDQTSAPVSAAADPSLRSEVGTIFAHSIRQRAISPADKAYLDATVASRTGLSPADADKRVSDVFDQAQQSIETARKAAAHTLYWLFVALLIGAFVASGSATFGGRERDRAHIGHANV
ncbi:MAG TPA: hypothetical protein VGQ30_08920 [Gemmatimonadaceae bacterium]|nr:hypothetical protein [Gemmatimonadaceae bacterium]